MVDWERVERLRSRGWDWGRIAADPKVGFHPDASVREPGPALRGLYHRQRSREQRHEEAAPPRHKPLAEGGERAWSFARVGYLLTPLFGIWFLLAFFAPSPVGLILPAIPYLALAVAVAAFLLGYGLFRASGRRWTQPLRSTLVVGVVLGLLIAGLIAVGGVVFFGCPLLPSAASAHAEPGPGWTSVAAAPWQDAGRPVVYSYGATWCPFCSASTWAIWKAVTSFSSPQPPPTPSMGYSAEDGIPEVVLSGLSVSSPVIALEVTEDTSGVVGSPPVASSCYQRAYVNAYAGGAIPFVVVNGQYVHGGSSLIPASALTPWANGANGGTAAVLYSVLHENGSAWSAVQGQTWWLMAFIVKSAGTSVSALASTYGWSAATRNAVSADLARIG